jgi:hypothetical protein
MPDQRCFFIVGCQRSGTTLLRLILETHSQIQCFDETWAYALLAGAPFPEPVRKEVLGFKIPRWTEQLDAPVLWDLGQPERPARIYSGQPIIFVVRHALDTIASMLKLKVGGQTWIERWAVPIIHAKAEDREFAGRYRRELSLVRGATYPSIAAGALYWKYKTAALLDYLEKGYPLLPLRYEHVTMNPALHLPNVCSFLDVPWEEALLDHPRIRHSEVFENGLTVGETNPNRPIDCVSVGQWPQFMSEEQCAVVDTVLGDIPLLVEAALRGRQ